MGIGFVRTGRAVAAGIDPGLAGAGGYVGDCEVPAGEFSGAGRVCGANIDTGGAAGERGIDAHGGRGHRAGRDGAAGRTR
jgi:hypothetical protein